MVKSKLFWATSYGVIGLLSGFILVYPVRSVVESWKLDKQMQELNELKAIGEAESHVMTFTAANNNTERDFMPQYSVISDEKLVTISQDDLKEQVSSYTLDPAYTLRTEEELSGVASEPVIVTDDYLISSAFEETSDNQKMLTILPQYTALYAKNSDFIGWLKIDGTNIDYPVMQTGLDRQWYYLDHDFDRENNKNGCLFVDERSDTGAGVSADFYSGGTLPSTNILIYGHNMANGSMFGHLQDYLKQDYADKHSIISYDTLYEQRKYIVVAALKTHVLNSDDTGFRYYNFINATTKAEFEEFKKFVKENNVIKSDREIGFGDEFITLSSCNKLDETDRYNENGRVVVIAVRIE